MEVCAFGAEAVTVLGRVLVVVAGVGSSREHCLFTSVS